jgi:hypothetical protein
MTSARWLLVPVVEVVIGDLWATQPGVLFQSLIEPSVSVGGDPLPHVIAWDGRLFLEDGHHRVVRAVINGATTMPARVLTLIARDRDPRAAGT